jgi:hypothetical protein
MTVKHTYRTNKGMETKHIGPLRAIRLQCLECTCWSELEISSCQSSNCPLFPFRFGYDPSKRGMMDEAHRKSLLTAGQQHRFTKKSREVSATPRGE